MSTFGSQLCSKFVTFETLMRSLVPFLWTQRWSNVVDQNFTLVDHYFLKYLSMFRLKWPFQFDSLGPISSKVFGPTLEWPLVLLFIYFSVKISFLLVTNEFSLQWILEYLVEKPGRILFTFIHYKFCMQKLIWAKTQTVKTLNWYMMLIMFPSCGAGNLSYLASIGASMG